MNALLAAQALSAVLTTVTQATAMAMEINTTINTARAEGRDVTDEEIAALQAENDRLEGEVLAALDALKP